MLVVDELRRDLGRPTIGGHDLFNGLVADRADDERRTGFVDENTVGFVHQAKVSASLYGLLAARIEAGGRNLAKQTGLRYTHPPQEQAVAEEIEPELLGGAVRDVAAVGLTA